MAEPPVFELIVENPANGIRIDSFLVRHFRNYTSWRMQRIVGAGGVTINSVRAEQTDRVFRRQTVQVRLIEPPDKLLEPELLPLDVLYEDHWLLVVNKPSDLIVHPVGHVQSGTLANAVQAYLDTRTSHPGLLRPGIVHRLDRETTGAIAVVLTHEAHAALAAAFESSRVAKSYLALVEGVVAADSGKIDYPIGRARTGRHVLMSCRADAIAAKPSQTNYQVLQRFRDHTLVLARPLTGRNHQIRVHFAAIGHPLVADEFYARNGQFKPFYKNAQDVRAHMNRSELPIQRHALHAAILEFAHPITDAWMTVHARLPTDFADTLQELAGSTSS